ncbi:hypothetical protein GQX73_g10650 [Xylaria multiplex]|uniref:F-box domain-containing protein n=1 Tax=Xylaria multiplex TaxID=323545 RepID=A0A7C8IKX7_9PEZI|nr:hypothetical protein GQX73_g10650 [Xylaria multiplex]
MSPPLSLDRVIEGRHIASPSSILFTIPREILHLIIGHVASDKSHLASLALVNSTCRQLARSCQFSNLHLDYGSAAVQVLAMLQKEAVQKYRSSDRMTVSPSLGACVRQLTVDATEYWTSLRSILGRDSHSVLGRDEREIEIARSAAVVLSEHLDHFYWPTALLVIPTLPNLRSLCISGLTLDDDILDCLIGLPIKSLKLSGQFLRIPNVRTERNVCPLQTLETLRIDTGWEFGFASNNTGLDPSSFYKTLLASCCSSLHGLEIYHKKFDSFSEDKKFKEMPLSFCMEFPKLKRLIIRRLTVMDARALSCLVREGLTFLNITYDDDDDDTSQFLSEIGQIRTLDTVILSCFEATGSTSTRFIEINTQIRSLAIFWTADAFLERVIQSLHHHESLKRLSLKWQEDDIPEASLEKFSLLPSIEMLHLSAGDDSGWPHNWFVDHNKLRRYVGCLSHLRRLIITRDTYPLQSDEVGFLDPGRYYDFRKPGSASWAAHETRMLEHAFAYVQTLPMLEFLHIGQVIFTVEKSNGVREPVVTGSAWIGKGEYDVLEKEFRANDVLFP